MEKDGMGEQTLSGPLGGRQPARLSWPEGRSGAPGFLAILVFSFSIIAGPVAVGDTPSIIYAATNRVRRRTRLRPGLQPFMEAAGEFSRQVAAGVICAGRHLFFWFEIL